jgi:hypothetical protein
MSKTQRIFQQEYYLGFRVYFPCRTGRGGCEEVFGNFLAFDSSAAACTPPGAPLPPRLRTFLHSTSIRNSVKYFISNSNGGRLDQKTNEGAG